ncbi:hypothetical protein NPIL_679711 [Nephila pilipes]|uniref:Uncharacterized protein n=1 Tax=Nephila pilipes TaxID=299642 RepID=A0A8X6PJJ9_NEPPI|nr:hypothetical protein NPIL_679711 [Nephila pilipes]
MESMSETFFFHLTESVLYGDNFDHEKRENHWVSHQEKQQEKKKTESTAGNVYEEAQLFFAESYSRIESINNSDEEDTLSDDHGEEN